MPEEKWRRRLAFDGIDRGKEERRPQAGHHVTWVNRQDGDKSREVKHVTGEGGVTRRFDGGAASGRLFRRRFMPGVRATGVARLRRRIPSRALRPH